MAIYTIELKDLLTNNSEGNMFTLWDFDFPIFDEEYRSVLIKKVNDRYYFREIGFETPARFKHYLRTRLNEIMPYYNQLYKSEHILNKEDFNPLYNLDTTETHTRTINQDVNTTGHVGTTTSDSTNNRDIFSDTPSNKLGDIDYATNVSEFIGGTNQFANQQNSGESKANTIEEYQTKVLGSGGLRYPADIIMEWRKSFLNIDKEILDNLNDLFMGVY